VHDEGGAQRVAPHGGVAHEQVARDQHGADPEHPERVAHRPGRVLDVEAAREEARREERRRAVHGADGRERHARAVADRHTCTSSPRDAPCNPERPLIRDRDESICTPARQPDRPAVALPPRRPAGMVAGRRNPPGRSHGRRR
jgi:hypothetical protein